MRSLVIAIPLSLAALVALAAACKNAREDSAPSEPAGGPPSEAQAYYTARCVACHGVSGAGNGPDADAFNPRPHNQTDPAWQASVTDDQIKEIIVRGGVKLGKSRAMPSNTRLRERPEVLDGLVKLIRGFGKPAKAGSAAARPVTPRP
jgi:mono/diheme cytochrome c family protein